MMKNSQEKFLPFFIIICTITVVYLSKVVFDRLRVPIEDLSPIAVISLALIPFAPFFMISSFYLTVFHDLRFSPFIAESFLLLLYLLPWGYTLHLTGFSGDLATTGFLFFYAIFCPPIFLMMSFLVFFGKIHKGSQTLKFVTFFSIAISTLLFLTWVYFGVVIFTTPRP